jgi:ATP-dependent DNA helicase HFM1/MER3
MRQNPNYYNFDCYAGTTDAEEGLENICKRDVKSLQQAKLVSLSNSTNRICCTDYGQAMSKYMVAFETMKLLLTIPTNAKMGQIVSASLFLLNVPDFYTVTCHLSGQ